MHKTLFNLLIVLALFCSSKVLGMTVENFTPELLLKSSAAVEIKTFWSKGHFGDFKGKDNIRINYATFEHENYLRNLVIVPGRSESYLKYKELAFDLFKQGYNIFILDHRGQGISERILSNGHKGYVKYFDDYAIDLHHFITHVVNKNNVKEKPYLLAHSMGGAVALRLMQNHPELIQASVLSSPMIAINRGGLPLWLAKIVIGIAEFFNHLLSDEPWYFFSQGDYQVTPFNENELTHSSIRYQRFIDEYQSNKYLHLGGVTFHWLNEAIKVNKLIFGELHKIKTPVMLLQAQRDTVVDNNVQNDFCRKLHAINIHSCLLGKPHKVLGAKHELFFEIDKYRDAALQQALSWYQLNAEVTLKK